jgi:hypothetical protein
MGIRITKNMGYGLDDVLTDKNGMICDPRFNESIVNGRDVDLDWREFLKYLKLQKKPYHALCYYWLRQKEAQNPDFTWRFSETFIHQGEFGIPGVFLVMPIEMTKNVESS